MPHKSTQPLGHWVFPARGAPYLVEEDLPDENEHIESAIVRKFIGALRQSTGRELAPPTRADSGANKWPDFETRERGLTIGIELVEIVDERHAMLRAIQREYTQYVNKLISDVASNLNGLRITLNDNYQEPQYPSIRSKAGQRLANSIARSLRSEIDRLQSLEINQAFNYRWQDTPGAPKTGAYGERFASPDSGIPAVIRFSESFYTNRQEMQMVLTKAIIKKSADRPNRRYADYWGDRLWLLAWESTMPTSLIDDYALLKTTAKLLDAIPHPFAEVWYVFPRPEEDSGFIKCVWQRSEPEGSLDFDPTEAAET